MFFSFYNFTDIIFGPREGMNSTSLAGEWAMFRRDVGHTGNFGLGGISPKGTLRWVFSTDSAIHSSPAVANGTVYIGSRDSSLYAVDVSTGTELWRFKTGSWIESSPAIVDGVIYFGSNDGHLYALDKLGDEFGNAKVKWNFTTTTEAGMLSSPAIFGN